MLWYDSAMKITVGSYYHDESRDHMQEVHVTLEDSDGENIFKDKWDSLPNNKKMEKLTAMADIYAITYAKTRGYQSEDKADARIQTLIREYII